MLNCVVHLITYHNLLLNIQFSNYIFIFFLVLIVVVNGWFLLFYLFCGLCFDLLCFVYSWLACVGCVSCVCLFSCIWNQTTNGYTPNFKFRIILCVWCWSVVVFCDNVSIKHSNTCWLFFLCWCCGLLLLLDIFFAIICELNFVNTVLFRKSKITLFPFSFVIFYIFLSWSSLGVQLLLFLL